MPILHRIHHHWMRVTAAYLAERQQTSRHGPLHPAVLLKNRVTLKPDLPAVFDAHARLGNGNLAPGTNDVTKLVAMPVSAVLTVKAAALLDFLFQEMVDDFPARLSVQDFDFGFVFNYSRDISPSVKSYVWIRG